MSDNTELLPFAEKVIRKLRRFDECASDFESGGVDIGRDWLDTLTQLGLLDRIQRSPALWEITEAGDQALAAPAEDVRAVVDEAVYQVCDGVNGWSDVELLRYTACQLDPEEYETRTLYRHPQRPVVLPGIKRFDWDRDAGMVEDVTGEYVLWSDIERLNK